jgi:hypothetical protein
VHNLELMAEKQKSRSVGFVKFDSGCISKHGMIIA